MGNLLKRLRNCGHDKETEKYGCDERVVFDLVFGELYHYLMPLDHGSHNYSSILHSGITQLLSPQNTVPIQAVKNLPQLVG